MQSNSDVIIEVLCAEINRLRDLVDAYHERLQEKVAIIEHLEEIVPKRGPGRPRKSAAKV